MCNVSRMSSAGASFVVDGVIMTKVVCARQERERKREDSVPAAVALPVKILT